MKFFALLAIAAIVACASAAVLPKPIYDGLVLGDDGDISEYEASERSPTGSEPSPPSSPPKIDDPVPADRRPLHPRRASPRGQRLATIREGSDSPRPYLLPVNLEDVDTDGGLPTGEELPPIRHPRVTCDLLSFGIKKWGTPSRVACPLRCLAQGRKGGSCKDGVCVCR